MKKTIITLLALAGVAAADTYTSSTYDKQDQAAPHYGFTITLADSSWVESTIPSDVTSVQLESLTLMTRDSNNSYADIKIAVYEYTSDNNVGTLLGLSSAESFSVDTDIEFSFDGSITLNPTARYQYMFVAADATAAEVDTFDEYKAKATQWGLALTNKQSVEGEYTFANIPTGWGVYTNGTVNGWQGMYLPVVTITTSTPNVPEPATATLSLLALAGLAARRRRASR